MNIYKRHRFSSDVIQFAVWSYFKFALSLRDVEDLLAARGIEVTRESIRQWCSKFGRINDKRIREIQTRQLWHTWIMDKVLTGIRGGLPSR